jgi:TolA-binding protein
LSYANELLAQNRNLAEVEPNSLFQVATMYQLKSGGKAGDDLLNAKNTYEELMQKYPNTDFAFFAELELKEIEGR